LYFLSWRTTFGGGKATPTTIAVAVPEEAAQQMLELWAEQGEREGEAQAVLLGAAGHRAMPIYGPTLSPSPDLKDRPAHPGIG
jgi:hypothetical protein